MHNMTIVVFSLESFFKGRELVCRNTENFTATLYLFFSVENDSSFFVESDSLVHQRAVCISLILDLVLCIQLL